MKKGHLVFLIFLIAMAVNGPAQKKEIIPSGVFLSESPVIIKPVYFLEENHYLFHPEQEIDSIGISGENNFRIKRIIGNHFSIYRDLSYDNKLIYPSWIRLKVYFKKQIMVNALIQVKLFPAVKIKFMDWDTKQEVGIKDNCVKGIERIYCSAVWDYPPYVSSKQSFRGHYVVNLMAGNSHVGQMENWYDWGAGGNTSYFELKNLAGFKTVIAVINETSILNSWEEFIIQKQRNQTIILYPGNPNRIKIEIPD